MRLTSLLVGLIGLLTLVSCKKTEEENDTIQVGAEKISVIHQPVPPIIHPELPGRPLEQDMNMAQKEFWNYLEQFNRLPENPTDVMQRIFDTKGVAPDFIYLSSSKSSVFGNIKGAMAHSAVFTQRYPWVRKLLEKYQITLDVDEILFAGSAQQILQNYQGFTENKLNLSNRVTYTKQWLECLLVLDYVFAHGSMEDRNSGIDLMSFIFDPPAIKYSSVEKLEELGYEMEVPAARDIAMALIDDFPEEVSELASVYPLMIFENCLSPDNFVNYAKWALRVEAFKKWENTRRLYIAHVGNSCVRNALKSYTVYWYHCHEAVRPEKGWADIAIQQLFKGLYSDNHKQEYGKYIKLLDTAYPPK